MDAECYIEYLPRAMADRDGWRERERQRQRDRETETERWGTESVSSTRLNDVEQLHHEDHSLFIYLFIYYEYAYGIATLVGYLMPNPVNKYIHANTQ